MAEPTVPPSDAETEAQLLEVFPLVRRKLDGLDRLADPELIDEAHELRESLRVALGLPA